jgi:hypothetical protein
MNTQRIGTPFSAQSTAAEVIKGIDLGGKRAIDLATARHPQTLLATLQRSALTVDHGAPLCGLLSVACRSPTIG